MEQEKSINIKVLLVGVDTGQESDFEYSMEELKNLARAAFKEPVGVLTQRMDTPNKAFYIGSGKVAELKAYAEMVEAEEIIFDDSLSPSQMRNLVDQLEIPVLDRTNLILDIFAMRAKTKESKLQVEMARLQYMLPRLVGMRENLSRQGGTGGAMSNKGAGETKLELDRRHIEKRISELKKELDGISKTRGTMRKRRNLSDIPKVALVGYTNAGKSTIMNRFVDLYGENSEKRVLEQDMLFATLETYVRRISPENGKAFFLSDTVGFIHKLPHGLIKAFQSTLEEVRFADLLVQVVDSSDEHYRDQMNVTAETLKEIGAGDIRQIVVFNKADLAGKKDIPMQHENQIHMAASLGIGIDELCEMIQNAVYEDLNFYTFLIPYDRGQVASQLMEHAQILRREYINEGILLEGNFKTSDGARYHEYLKTEQMVHEGDCDEEK